jgi:hypothetical protein
VKRLLAGALALAAGAVLANIRYGPVDLRPTPHRRGHTMPFTHPKLHCWVCLGRPASRVVEAKALAPYATDWDVEVESYYQLCCDNVDCLRKSADAADAGDSVHADTRELTRGEAEVISGWDLSEQVTR